MLFDWMTSLWTYSPNCGSQAWLTARYEKLRKLLPSTQDQKGLQICLRASLLQTPPPAPLTWLKAILFKKPSSLPSWDGSKLELTAQNQCDPVVSDSRLSCDFRST